MNKTLPTFLTIATIVALAAPAIAKPGTGPGKAPKVTVSISSNLYSAHEVGDLIIYYINVANNSDDAVTVTDALTGFEATVAANESPDTFKSSCYLSVTAGDYCYISGVPAADEPSTTLTNTVVAQVGAEVVASDTAETAVFGYDECGTDGNGTFMAPEGYSVCIWKPSQPGDWTFHVTPAPPGKKSVSIIMNLRDHVPGNWCPLTPNEVWRWRGEPEVLEFRVQRDDWGSPFPLIPAGWHGEAICPDGGSGGDPMSVGTPGSFYLATYGPYEVTATLTLPPED